MRRVRYSSLRRCYHRLQGEKKQKGMVEAAMEQLREWNTGAATA